MKFNGIEVSDAQIAEYCREWQVVELHGAWTGGGRAGFLRYPRMQKGD